MVLQLITVWNAQLKLSNQSWLMESRSRPGRQLWMPWEIFKPECVQTVSVSTDVCKATLGFAYGDYLSCLDRGADRSPFSKLIRTWVWVITVLPWPVLPVQVSVFCLESQLREKPAGGAARELRDEKGCSLQSTCASRAVGWPRWTRRGLTPGLCFLHQRTLPSWTLRPSPFLFFCLFVSSQIELSVEKIKEAESLKALTLTCF